MGVGSSSLWCLGPGALTYQASLPVHSLWILVTPGCCSSSQIGRPPTTCTSFYWSTQHTPCQPLFDFFLEVHMTGSLLPSRVLCPAPCPSLEGRPTPAVDLFGSLHPLRSPGSVSRVCSQDAVTPASSPGNTGLTKAAHGGHCTHKFCLGAWHRRKSSGPPVQKH